MLYLHIDMQTQPYTNSSVYKDLCVADITRKCLWSFGSVGVYGLWKPKQMYIEWSFVVLLGEMTVSLMSFQIANPEILSQTLKLSVAA